MAKRHPPHTPPSEPDGDGVRVVAKASAPGRARWAVLALVAMVAVIAWFALARGPSHRPSPEPLTAHDGGNDVDEQVDPAAARVVQSKRTARSAYANELAQVRSTDPEDLAAYFEPGDPEPTGAEVIAALRQSGIHTGIGAFNPPGTSPPLEGLAVPDGFPLPAGYVRHHQVTDEGVPIEPILMFSPDVDLVDAQGRVVAMPPNRVVPPQLAPPGMPLRVVRVGSP